jgi:mannose-6-phosphate isomerase-like protein (cupin superfamily)
MNGIIAPSLEALLSNVRNSRKLWTLLAATIALLSVAVGPLRAQAGTAPSTAVPRQVWTQAGSNSFDGPKDIIYPDKLAPVDTRLNMYFGDWRDSLPHAMFGSLVVRDILTPGDNLSPPTPGAVLEQARFLSYATLAAGDRTVPSTLKGVQLFFYVEDGVGEISAGGKTADLHRDVAVLVPEGLEFTLHNTGETQLVAYLIGDPTFPGFKPLPSFAIVDETKKTHVAPLPDSPFTTPGANGHWAHISHSFFTRTNGGGLASVGSIITVEIPPMQLGEPHPHLPGKEEVWCQIEGTSLAFVGPQVRMQHPGQAYILRPDGLTTHSNINFDEPGTTPIKFLWFSTNTGLSAAPH